MSIELEKYVLDRLIRSEKQAVTTAAVSLDQQRKIVELESIQDTLAAEVKQLTADKNSYMRQITDIETRVRDAKPRLEELWSAAQSLRQDPQLRLKRWTPMLERLEKAIHATVYDCTDEIQF
jgi:hypothetical protein